MNTREYKCMDRIKCICICIERELVMVKIGRRGCNSENPVKNITNVC